MAEAIIVTLEKEIPELAAYTKGGTGKAIARELSRLDMPARACKVSAITGLISENQAALIEKMRETGMDPTKMRLPPELWFAAADGSKTAQALADYVESHLNDFKQPNPLIRDLKAAGALLAAAAAANVRFHFTQANL